MDVVGVIPARWGSSRFEGKVLADILGKPMLQHVWERVQGALLLNDVIIACDDERVASSASSFGAKVVITSKDHPSGTDRIAEVVNPLDVKIVVNIQADEPLIHPAMIDQVVRPLLNDPTISVSTLIKRIDDPSEINDPNVVKAVVDQNNFALYFSRAAIPHRAINSEVEQPKYYKHIGLYAYTKDFLFIYRKLPASILEKTEKLEQLRILEDGFRIKTTETNFDTIGVDTPEDLEKVKIRLQSQGKGA
ncbi:MAG: 3-deoxy-manno-octulosonate cytidylyltransferase [Candidatus Omnitrophica bacterium]|nr:3-deoxy-manno-octulosonate cytidylyltransferase [Candidatus Omnitrophota bacterium]MDD5236150.1 3-deoxy-manno-octulosonate cytidylyltransferase [Candidatus Omnitrophota bacterium]MDD5611351.1 3-deoxy-manno-octulosonate cytidylyltransferase [Candidatus Omnitrophota bacterium]